MKLYKVFVFWEFLIFLLLLFLSLFLLLYYFHGIESSFIRKGVKSLYRKDFSQAQKDFNRALIKSPYNPWIHINLALSYDFLKVPNKAFKTYDIIPLHLAKKSKGASFYTHFNKGELSGRLGLLEKALTNYQKALEFQYKEKMIKENIELLLQAQQSQNNNKKPKQKENKPDNPQEQKNSQEENKFRTKQDSEDQTDPSPKELSEKDQAAILKEIEKQENKTRLEIYRRKSIFGDKSEKDW